MKKETRKRYIKYILNSFLGMCVYLFYGVIFNGNHTYMFPATCATFFIVALIMARKEYSLARDISIFLLMFMCILITLILSNNISTVAGTITYLIMMPISVFMGSWARRRKLRIAYFALLLLFVSLFVRPNLIHYFWNTDAFIDKKLPEIAFFDLENNNVSFDTEVTVIDLWSTSCGVCFEKFPEFEQLKKDFETQKNISFYSVNVPLRNDSREKTLATIKELKYDYETIFTEKYKIIQDSLQINGFPYLMIVKNDTIRYLGALKTDRTIVLTNTKDVIQNILEE